MPLAADPPVRRGTLYLRRQLRRLQTSQDLKRFAKHLGIPAVETDLLWIAEEALNAPLPRTLARHELILRRDSLCRSLCNSDALGRELERGHGE
jgi:hypothetical protein